ncbi:MAG TPA: bifunctional glycosyltransferase/class I SAM-dependent methyltransferase [Pyrinomonadaceae bacterium]|jgi:glycosyltransferase involved in cell wall biosynthesis|nr:bifunctional glycosyltransferase/class I SAM-dependent methyltransferase [Pyrinomonadaceae bacterium]
MATTPKKRIGIFVIAYNAVNKLDWTLDRIPEEVWEKVEEVFLFDDCSTDNTYYAAIGYKHVRKLEKLTIHRNKRNLRYGGNQKQGYQYAIARDLDIVVMLHADGQYAPESLPKLLEPLEHDEADMVFGSRMAEGGAPLQGGMPLYKFIGNKILTWLENKITGMKLSEFHSGYRIYSCAALKRIPFLLNSNEWHFDTDILIQFHEAGMRVVEEPIPTYYGDEICYVNGIAYAFNCLRSALTYRLHKARLLHVQKYEIKPSQYVYKQTDPYSSHAQILNWVKKQRPEEVLEVGTASGYLTAEMVKLGCRVTGVEQNVEMASLAEQYCNRMLIGDIESLELNSLGEYDAIILGDILEHVRNPRAVLQKVSKHLRPGGRVLISLPNVANIWVRLNLLLGRFNYSRVGILDESHLRFFTLHTSKKLAHDSGLDVIGINTTPIPLPLLLPATQRGRSLSFLHGLNWGLARLRKTLFGYQFILVCRDPNNLEEAKAP